MTKIYFARVEAAHAFASMAEAMAENQTDLDKRFEADKYTLIANMIWDELQRDDGNLHHPYFVTVPNAAGDFATAGPRELRRSSPRPPVLHRSGRQRSRRPLLRRRVLTAHPKDDNKS